MNRNPHDQELSFGVNDHLLNGFIAIPNAMDSLPDSSINWFETTLPTSTLSDDSVKVDQKLGYLAEDLLEFYINDQEQDELIHKNLQVIENGKTLGEFDFLLKNLKRKEFIHLELACKFLLKLPGQTGFDKWVGPANRDSLERKMNHLFDHQFKLLQSPAAKNLLNSMDIPAKQVRQQLCFKLSAFRHNDDQGWNTEGINEACLAGTWIHAEEFRNASWKKLMYYLPKKALWLMSPNRYFPFKSWTDIQKEVDQFHAQRQSPMLWTASPDGTLSRLFVVFW